MTISPGECLHHQLRALALALATSGDRGWEPTPLYLHLRQNWEGPDDDPDVVTDVLLTAMNLLAGLNPDLDDLVEVHDPATLLRVIDWAIAQLRALPQV